MRFSGEFICPALFLLKLNYKDDVRIAGFLSKLEKNEPQLSSQKLSTEYKVKQGSSYNRVDVPTGH